MIRKRAPVFALNRLAHQLRTDYRFWARAGSETTSLLIEAHTRRRVGPEAQILVARPRFPRGFCRVCGCSEFDPCMGPTGSCAWVDATERLCTSCAPRDVWGFAIARARRKSKTLRSPIRRRR